MELLLSPQKGKIGWRKLNIQFVLVSSLCSYTSFLFSHFTVIILNEKQLGIGFIKTKNRSIFKSFSLTSRIRFSFASNSLPIFNFIVSSMKERIFHNFILTWIQVVWTAIETLNKAITPYLLTLLHFNVGLHGTVCNHSPVHSPEYWLTKMHHWKGNLICIKQEYRPTCINRKI